jgi:hypothetical protein
MAIDKVVGYGGTPEAARLNLYANLGQGKLAPGFDIDIHPVKSGYEAAAFLDREVTDESVSD